MKQWKLWMHNARGRGGLSWLSKIVWLRITGCRKVLLSWWHDEAMKDINAKCLSENRGRRAPSIYLACVRESQIADPFWGEKEFEIWILLWRLQRVGIMNASKDFIFWSCCKGFDFVNSVLNRIFKYDLTSKVFHDVAILDERSPLLNFQTSKFNIFR